MKDSVKKELKEIEEKFQLRQELIIKDYHTDKIVWKILLGRKLYSSFKLSEEFMMEFKDIICWEDIFFYQKLSEEFMREVINIIPMQPSYWIKIPLCNNLSENFIKDFKDMLNWKYVFCTQSLSESFIKYIINKIPMIAEYWKDISKCQKLSENFIEEFKDNMDWKQIWMHQSLSERFIKRFFNRLNEEDFWSISRYQKLSMLFIYMNRKLLSIPILIDRGLITRQKLQELREDETKWNIEKEHIEYRFSLMEI